MLNCARPLDTKICDIELAQTITLSLCEKIRQCGARFMQAYNIGISHEITQQCLSHVYYWRHRSCRRGFFFIKNLSFCWGG